MITTHEPENYNCPICKLVEGSDKDSKTKLSDIVYQDSLVTAFVSAFTTGKNPGHIVIVPNSHFENLYTLPEKYGTGIFIATQEIAKAIKKTFDCEGITIRQNNEPVGDQHTFHYHQHIYPRYTNDDFNVQHPDNKILLEEEARSEQVKKLKATLETLV